MHIIKLKSHHSSSTVSAWLDVGHKHNAIPASSGISMLLSKSFQELWFVDTTVKKELKQPLTATGFCSAGSATDC